MISKNIGTRWKYHAVNMQKVTQNNHTKNKIWLLSHFGTSFTTYSYTMAFHTIDISDTF